MCPDIKSKTETQDPCQAIFRRLCINGPMPGGMVSARSLLPEQCKLADRTKQPMQSVQEITEYVPDMNEWESRPERQTVVAFTICSPDWWHSCHNALAQRLIVRCSTTNVLLPY